MKRTIPLILLIAFSQYSFFQLQIKLSTSELNFTGVRNLVCNGKGEPVSRLADLLKSMNVKVNSKKIIVEPEGE